MKEYLYIGATPWNVVPIKVGSPNYHKKARKECERFIEQIIRHYGNPPGEARLIVESFRHEATDYFEVVCYFEKNEPIGMKYAVDIEADVKKMLREWDQTNIEDMNLPD